MRGLEVCDTPKTFVEKPKIRAKIDNNARIHHTRHDCLSNESWPIFGRIQYSGKLSCTPILHNQGVLTPPCWSFRYVGLLAFYAYAI